MEEEYNWSLISIVSVPFALITAFIFYTSIANLWKWISLVMGLFLTGLIVYITNKKKSNVFTAIGLVFLVALIVRFLKNFGII